MPSRQLSVAVAVLVVAAFLFVAIAPAFATPAAPAALPLHASLVGSTPADGDSVETATEVVLSFNEEVNADFVQVVVEGPDGAEADGDPVVDGRDVTQALAADLRAGAHTVTYRVVSTDGHPVSGAIEFTTTATPSTSPSPSASQSGSPTTAPADSSASTPAPSADASPEVEPTSESGPSTTVWVALGIVALALVATFIGLAARGDRRSSREPTA